MHAITVLTFKPGTPTLSLKFCYNHKGLHSLEARFCILYVPAKAFFSELSLSGYTQRYCHSERNLTFCMPFVYVIPHACHCVWQQKQNTSLPVKQTSHTYKASNSSWCVFIHKLFLPLAFKKTKKKQKWCSPQLCRKGSSNKEQQRS